MLKVERSTVITHLDLKTFFLKIDQEWKVWSLSPGFP